MEVQKDILWRVYLVYFVAFCFSILIVGKVAKIQYSEGDMWRERAQKLQVMDVNIEAVRGNIYANDGSLMATSVPFYEVRMDVNADPITNKVFNENIDSLSYYLSNLFGDKTEKDYKNELRRAREKGERYHFIQKNVRYNQLKALKKFPMFRLGKYKGGLIYIQQNRRELPFRSLAARTIGYDRIAQKPVGIEGAYNNYLKGVGGKRLMQKIAGNVWMPINDENEIEPKNGSDVYTSIDVNIQDVAQSALEKQLKLQNADHGCLALMEVQTGQIKAIVNLSRTDSSTYAEQYNYVIGESTEPGSTFKLASLMVALEDGYATLDETVDTENGVVKFYNVSVHDSHEGGLGKITVQQIFEKSSNVGVAKLIVKNYGKNPQKFIDGLYAMSIQKPLNLDIPGEGMPRIKSTKEKDWSGVSLPQISYGYETKLTPLQILTFYNAVANNGIMVKPQFVKEIRNSGSIEKVIQPVVINPAICSPSTIRKAKKMLEGVVQYGTATNLKNTPYKIAAKTGTAQLANGKYGYKYKEKVSYQASLAGYFPAENPKYSMIIVINAPSNKVYYGNDVAGPIFREVADKVYATSMEIHKELVRDTTYVNPRVPIAKAGYRQDLELVANNLNISNSVNNKSSDWVKATSNNAKISMSANSISKNKTPDVVGMGLKDALFLLENSGLSVTIVGRGSVVKQSLPAGTKINKGANITIELS